MLLCHGDSLVVVMKKIDRTPRGNGSRDDGADARLLKLYAAAAA
jgi:hypothetical protein